MSLPAAEFMSANEINQLQVAKISIYSCIRMPINANISGSGRIVQVNDFDIVAEVQPQKQQKVSKVNKFIVTARRNMYIKMEKRK